MDCEVFYDGGCNVLSARLAKGRGCKTFCVLPGSGRMLLFVRRLQYVFFYSGEEEGGSFLGPQTCLESRLFGI